MRNFTRQNEPLDLVDLFERNEQKDEYHRRHINQDNEKRHMEDWEAIWEATDLMGEIG
ncbi:MAG: hypothetical protein GY861_02700 [bacterium]|nr:hypothetical protein [bacterium]